MDDNIQFWQKDDFSWESCVDKIKSSINIDKKMAIISMGSCFGVEIKRFLLSKGYNYLLGEKEKPFWEQGSTCRNPLYHASVAWERVFNTFTFLNIIEYSLENKHFDRLYVLEDDSVMDLIRNNIIYPSMDVAKKDIEIHKKSSENVLKKADLLIFTLGLTEIWEDVKRKFVLGGRTKSYDCSDCIFRVSSFSENINNLSNAYDIIKEHNKNIKILLTVSPVHLKATFRDDVDIYSASCSSKSTLRAVANEFVSSHNDVYYFPSYELITMVYPRICNREIGGRIWRMDDNRHVAPKLIKKILKQFINN